MNILSLIAILEKVFTAYGFPIVFLSSLVEMSPIGWAIPGGAIVAIAGFFSYTDTQLLLNIVLLGWAGSWFSFLLAYLLGKKTGYTLVKRFKKEKSANRAKVLLKKHGGVILTTSMMTGLTRFWVAYVAGTQEYNLPKFVFYSGAASLTWTSLQVIVGYIAGSKRSSLESGLGSLGILSWGILALAILVILLANKKEHDEFKEDLE